MVLSCMDLFGDTVANWDKILVVKWKIAVKEYDVSNQISLDVSFLYGHAIYFQHRQWENRLFCTCK